MLRLIFSLRKYATLAGAWTFILGAWILLVGCSASSGNSNENGPLGGNHTLPDSAQIFPADNAWNTDISAAPVDANSDNYIASIGASTGLHADFTSDGY